MNCPNNKEGYIIPHCYTMLGTVGASGNFEFDTFGLIQFSSYPEILIFEINSGNNKMSYPVFISLSQELNTSFKLYYSTNSSSPDITSSKVSIVISEADLYHVKFRLTNTSTNTYNWKAIFCC